MEKKPHKISDVRYSFGSHSYYEMHPDDPSKNLFIRIMDTLCARSNRKDGKYYLQEFAFGFYLLYTMIVVFINFKLILYGMGALFIYALLPIESTYRFFRHRYLRKHNLAGPYGWGTIDEYSSACYEVEWNSRDTTKPTLED